MMKKQILNLGKALNKAEQKEINGGGFNDSISQPGGGSGGTGSGSGGNYGVCIEWKGRVQIVVRTHCNDLCSNGTQPICGLQ